MFMMSEGPDQRAAATRKEWSTGSKNRGTMSTGFEFRRRFAWCVVGGLSGQDARRSVAASGGVEAI